jgi:hypothetical protein
MLIATLAWRLIVEVLVNRKTMLATTFLLVVSILTLQAGCGFYLTGLSNKTNYDTLLLSLQTDRDRIQVGETVHMRFTVTNQGDTWVLESKDTPVMDITVGIMGDGDITSWSAQNPDQGFHRLEWKRGESKVIEWTWTPKEGDVYIGAFHDIHLSGQLNKDSKIIQAAGVTLCSSNVCR